VAVRDYFAALAVRQLLVILLEGIVKLRFA